MKRDFSGPVLNLNGEQVMEQFADKDGSTKTRPLLVKDACTAALMAADQRRPVEDHIRRYNLAEKINAGGMVDITAEDVVLLKAAIAEMFNTLVVGFLVRRLEQE